MPKVVNDNPRRLVSRIDKTSSRVRRSWATWRAPAAGPGDAGLIRDRVRHRTKQLVSLPREQLTLCGLQTFPSGASVLWETELEEDQDYLFPESQPRRVGRLASHLFCSTIVPRKDDVLNMEYLVKLEVGGLPGWLTSPVVVETIKKMFWFADGYFRSGFEEGGDLAKRGVAVQ